MAIEPLNSAMTYQAQAAVKPQTVTQVNTEVPEDGQTVNVDATTASVTKVQAEDEQAGSEGNGRSSIDNVRSSPVYSVLRDQGRFRGTVAESYHVIAGENGRTGSRDAGQPEEDDRRHEQEDPQYQCGSGVRRS